MNQMRCPKCEADMRSYERNGVIIEQCGECRGVFLDRGELDQMINAESQHYKNRSNDLGQGAWYGERERYHDEYRGHDSHHKKRGSFLSELFDD